MKVLVTGGLGYLGAHVTRHFLAEGHDVTALTRTGHPDVAAQLPGVRVLTADLTDPRTLDGCCAGVDLVVHAAALNAQQSAANPRAALLVNGLGTRGMLAEAARAGVPRFLYLSTIHVYGPLATHRLDESVPPRPANDYAVTKLAGESYCGQASAVTPLSVAVLRPSNGYGAPVAMSADCWMLAVNDFCRRAVEQGEIVLTSAGTQQRDFVALADIVRAVALLADPALGKEPLDEMVYDVGGNNSHSIREVADLVAAVFAEEFGREVPVRVAATAPPAAGHEPRIGYGMTRIERLGYRPAASMREEIRGILRFLAAQGQPSA